MAPAVTPSPRAPRRKRQCEGRAVYPGDRLRVELNGAGYRFVSVAGRSPGQEQPLVLFEGTIAGGDQLLPVSFRVDGEGNQEILSVIFGRQPIPAELHARAREAPPAEDEATTSERPAVWRQLLVLDKENP